MDLRGKAAFVTGGGRGIGAACVRALAARGAEVFFTYHRSAASARQLVDDLTTTGALVDAAPCDVVRDDDVGRAVDACVRRFGGVDVLVNNAGVLPRFAAIEDLDEATWDDTLAVNLKGMFLATRAALPHLKARDAGRVVNMASIAGQMGGRAGVHYAASKAGVLGFTKALATELAQYGILVNAVAPEIVDTDLTPRKTRERLKDLNLLKRLLRPEEVADVVVFLCEQDHMTGQTITLNAGRYVL